MSHAALTVDHPVMPGAPPFTPPLSLFLLLCRYNSYFCAYMCTCYTIMTKVCAHTAILFACLLAYNCSAKVYAGMYKTNPMKTWFFVVGCGRTWLACPEPWPQPHPLVLRRTGTLIVIQAPTPNSKLPNSWFAHGFEMRYSIMNEYCILSITFLSLLLAILEQSLQSLHSSIPCRYNAPW